MPVNAIVWGLFTALSVSLNVPDRVPVEFGRNRRLSTQLAPGFNVAAHVALETRNSLAPLMLQYRLISAPVPILVIVSATMDAVFRAT